MTMENTKDAIPPFAAAQCSAKYDHDEVRCDEMADSDCDNKMVGEPRTCCVCAGHDCAVARAERLNHPARISPKDPSSATGGKPNNNEGTK